MAPRSIVRKAAGALLVAALVPASLLAQAGGGGAGGGGRAGGGGAGGAGAAGGGRAAAPVTITLTKFGNNFYAIDGSGGRAGALVGPDGIFEIDAQSAAAAAAIIVKLKEVSDQPIKYLVNTHVHADHTGGNATIAATGATLLSRPKLRDRLANPPAPAGGGAAPAPAPAAALAKIVYDTIQTYRMNGEVVELIPVQNGAHTDGDTAVRFRNANVLMTGDVFRSTGYPNIDTANGGKLDGILAGLQQLADLANDQTVVIPGHGDITNKAAILAHLEVAKVIRDRVQTLMRQGKTVEEIVASKPTADYDDRVGSAAQSADRYVRQLFEELTRLGGR